jgi:hypothetical protein
MSEFCEVITVGFVIAFILPVYEIVRKELVHFGMVIIICLVLKKSLSFLKIDKQFCNVIEFMVSFLICIQQFHANCGIVFIIYLVLRSLF